jgi:hypothetical protein
MLVFLGLFLFALARCKSPESEIEEANITVSDECGVTVDIFMDGEFQFSLEYLSTDIIASVALGVHEFEAKKEGTEDLVTTETYDIYAGGSSFGRSRAQPS